MMPTAARSQVYAALEEKLAAAAARSTTSKHWPERVFKTAAQPGVLAVSWLGDAEYEIALEASREAAKVRARLKSQSGRHRGGEPSAYKLKKAELDAKLAVRAGYKGEKNARYAYSAYVFYKTHEGPPSEIFQIESDLAAAYRNAPLHHLLMVCRRQAINDETPASPDPWILERPTFATDEALVGHLMDRVFPEPCPKPRAGRMERAASTGR